MQELILNIFKQSDEILNRDQSRNLEMLEMRKIKGFTLGHFETPPYFLGNQGSVFERYSL
jgi:hypothetical protein